MDAYAKRVALNVTSPENPARADQATLPASPTGTIDQASCGNLLLRRLSSDDFTLLQPYLRRVPLTPGAKLAQAGQPIESVSFLEGGIGGYLDVLADGQQLAVGLVGREGLVGWPLLLGNDRWPYDVVVRGADSTALGIGAADFAGAVDRSRDLHRTMLRYTGTFVTQMSRTIVSNLIHSIDRRAARWILLYHDRLQGDEIPLTHEELSAMLGVRRASITDALHLLESEHAIKGLRGRVIVRDRARLEALAGETYGFAEAEYRRLIELETARSIS